MLTYTCNHTFLMAHSKLRFKYWLRKKRYTIRRKASTIRTFTEIIIAVAGVCLAIKGNELTELENKLAANDSVQLETIKQLKNLLVQAQHQDSIGQEQVS